MMSQVLTSSTCGQAGGAAGTSGDAAAADHADADLLAAGLKDSLALARGGHGADHRRRAGNRSLDSRTRVDPPAVLAAS